MRLTKDNIDKYLTENGGLNLYGNKEIKYIDFLPNYIKWINLKFSNVEEITCELPERLKYIFCQYSKLTSLPLLPKSLISFDGGNTKLPNEFRVSVIIDNEKCNQLRKLQMINSI